MTLNYMYIYISVSPKGWYHGAPPSFNAEIKTQTLNVNFILGGNTDYIIYKYHNFEDIANVNRLY